MDGPITERAYIGVGGGGAYNPNIFFLLTSGPITVVSGGGAGGPITGIFYGISFMFKSLLVT